MLKKVLFFVLFISHLQSYAQDDPITLYTQFSGRYSFITIGNTLNTTENNIVNNCSILTESSTELSLTPGTTIEAAYLYWAGSGDGDFAVTLNGTAINAERTFSDVVTTSGVSRNYFSAFANVTELVLTQGNGIYTLSDLDLTDIIYPGANTYCGNATNFGGWAITCILKNESYPLNQLNVYDGLEHVPDAITIELDNLVVFNPDDAQIGFLAWEGDAALSTETLTINGIPVGNPPLNPVDNAFNGTNSFTGNDNLYNMDIDAYDLGAYINEGDTNVTIALTSTQDVVLVNNVVTVLNSFIIADATVTELNTQVMCDSRTVQVFFKIGNYNSSASIPSGTSVNMYVDGQLIESLLTSEIVPDGEEVFSLYINIPDTIPDTFTISVVVDEENQVEEIEENNNSAAIQAMLVYSPEIPQLSVASTCDVGYNTGLFDLEAIVPEVAGLSFSGFFTTEEDVNMLTASIFNSDNYQSTGQGQIVYYRYDSDFCYTIGTLVLNTYNCPPIIPQGFSPNGDRKNDTFNIQGLWTIFDRFTLKIYSRYGTLLYKGDQNSAPWDGIANTNTLAGKTAPVGTYYYVLTLNDEIFETYTGWVYLNK